LPIDVGLGHFCFYDCVQRGSEWRWWFSHVT